MIRQSLFLAAILVAAATSSASAAGAKWDCDKVDYDTMDTTGWKAVLAGPDVVETGKPATFTIDIAIATDHILYQQHADIAAPEGAKGVTIGKATWPTTKRKFDELLKKELDYWDGAAMKATVPVTFDGKAGKRTLELVVTQQACNPCVCLMPTPITLTKSVTVKAPTSESAVTPVAPAATPDATATSTAVAEATPVAATTPLLGTATVTRASTSSAFASQERMAELIRTNFLLALGVAFLGGLLISLTPCVYPMIPITIAVIGNQATKGGATAAQSRTRGFFLSLVYVVGITAIYATLGVVAAKSGKEFGFAMRNPWVLLSVAGVFLALAASMFGAFQIQLPTGLQTKLATYQGSGTVGVFVTGLFAGIVAGPCTAPVLIGILLAISAGSVGTGGGFALMTAFSLGMGVLFVVLGTFSGLLSSLPRSGAWMDTVKHVFGVMLVGAALYFVSLSVPEWIFALALGASLVFLGVGLGAALRLDATSSLGARFRQGTGWLAAVAGIFFFLGGLAGSGWGPQWLPAPGTGGSTEAVLASHGPEVPWIESEPEGVRLSAETGKPMFIDFWADDCRACKELDAHTYTDSRVIDLAKQSFVPMKIDVSTPFGTSAKRLEEITALKKKYDVRGLPKVVFVRPDGSVIDKELTVYGFVPADDMLERMNAARTCAPDATTC